MAEPARTATVVNRVRQNMVFLHQGGGLGAGLSPFPSPPYAGERVGVRALLRSVLKPLTPALSPGYRGEGVKALLLRGGLAFGGGAGAGFVRVVGLDRAD